jgi:Divergent InlB B-repeat domain
MHKLICSLAFALSLLLAGSASAQGVWNDGSASRLQHRCVLGIDLVDTIEDLTWTWVGFFGLPQVGQVYYARISVGGLGCSGAWGIPEVKLPRGTSFAITPSNPVRCYMKSANQSSPNQITDGTCPSEPFIGLYPDSNGSFPNPGGSGYSNQFFSFPPMTQPYWPLPPGTILTIEFPIISSQPLSGFASNDYLLGAVNVLDNNPGGPTVQWDGHPSYYSGYGIPSSGAWQGVFVTQGPYSGPRIVYPEPSTQNITQSGGDTLVHVYNTSCLSQNVVSFELYPADDNEPDTTVFLGGSCTALGDGGSSCSASWNGFQPDTLYKWRAYFLPGTLNACPNVVEDDTFKLFQTPPLPGATRYTLLATAEGNGSVALAPTGGSYAPGTLVTATALPGSGASFAGWRFNDGSTSGTNPVGVTMSQSRTIVAEFVPEPGAALQVGAMLAALVAIARRRSRFSVCAGS